jgi:hypothetical protein
MSQRKDAGLNINPWPKLVDHYTFSESNFQVDIMNINMKLRIILWILKLITIKK